MSIHTQTASGVPGASVPDFLIGQDHSGHWLALETHGRAGGFFASREAALHFALEEAGHRAEAIHLTSERIEFHA